MPKWRTRLERLYWISAEGSPARANVGTDMNWVPKGAIAPIETITPSVPLVVPIS